MARAEAVSVARSWIGTPYELRGRVKGAGVDCATFLAEYLTEIGASTRADLEDLGFYAHDWFCHTSSERYLLRMMRHARKVLDGRCRGTVAAEPGSMILFRLPGSRILNHGGVITRWPFMVHATGPKVQEANCTTHWMTGFVPFELFDPFPEVERA